MRLNYKVLVFLLAAALPQIVISQPVQPSSSAILLKMKKLNVLGSALYVAAHPDDENTRLIGYLSNGELVNTAYLALTRGDGGQNLIGPEMREGLGLIRTQELLAARSVDGSTQFFSRANDFGYSKTPKETLKIWDKDQVLHDAVWAIRKFRPDVIITRFPPDSRAGHGHHTTSAIIAAEAFSVAASDQYQDQLEVVEPWQATRLMLNSGRWWDPDVENSKDVIKVDIGQYNALLGESYSEAAARSRSMHKSQGFGSQGSRGSSYEYLSIVDGKETTTTIFDGIDISWNRVGQPNITREVSAIINAYNPENPSASVKALIALHKNVAKVKDEFWRQKKLAEIEDLIIDCSGLFIGAWAADFAVVPGSDLPVSIELVNRSPVNWSLNGFTIEDSDSSMTIALGDNEKVMINKTFHVKSDTPISGPYWLEEEGTIGMYRVDDLNLIGLPENPPVFKVTLDLAIDDFHLLRELPLIYHWTDRVNGEMTRPITVVPPAYLNLSNPVYIFNNGEPKIIDIMVEASTDELEGVVSLIVPNGWQVSPADANVTIAKKGGTEMVSFKVTPSGDRSGNLTASIEVNDKHFSRSKYELQYLHIPYQIMLPKASARVENLEVVNMARTVGYVMGAGDNVPEGLEQMGIKVWLMTESDLTTENLSQLDAVVFGIRAVNTLAWLPSKKPLLLDYVNNGGTMIMQYNTTRGISWEDFAPYELKFSGGSADSRVAEETAEVTIINANHQVLNYPNKINANDFDGWVQERGLYFPSEWDSHYVPVLSMHDEDEDPKEGSLLIADYGKGHYVYTGLSWFRELPAGVPGAYRLLSNVLSLSSPINPEPIITEKSKKAKTKN